MIESTVYTRVCSTQYSIAVAAALAVDAEDFFELRTTDFVFVVI